MKIFRGPNTSTKWKRTDTKAPKEYVKDWRPGGTILFDGTIQKSGERHTDIGVEIGEADILALHSALIKSYKEAEKERMDLEKRVDELEEAFAKVSRLVTFRRRRAPDTEALLEAIEEISDHFMYTFDQSEKFKSNFSWLQWKSL